MPRWTIRGIPADSIKAVQESQIACGATLGQIVSACIQVGLPQVRLRLEREANQPNRLGTEIVALQTAIQRAIAALGDPPSASSRS